MKKRVTALLLAVSVLISCFALGSFYAYAESKTIDILDLDYSIKTTGSEDMALFLFTPDESGTYSLLSYNVAKSNCYLMIKTVNEDGSKTLEQLAFSNGNENYEADGQKNQYQFRLTYHLEKGVTYYYYCGWNSANTTFGTMNVRMRCDSYDDDVIDHIELECNVKLQAFSGGSWQKDYDGNSFYFYSISRIAANMNVTLVYKNGERVSSGVGKDTVDGHQISYRFDQMTTHWYPENNDEYSGSNTLTVCVLDKTADFNVPIESVAMYTVYGKVADYYDGQPIENASITVNGSAVAKTDSQGEFSYTAPAGFYNATITSDKAISRNVTYVVEAEAGKNDFRNNPVTLVTGDYNRDGVINVKDYAYIDKNLSGDEQLYAKNKFKFTFTFTTSSYESLKISDSQGE